jgi:hypothetical protein
MIGSGGILGRAGIVDRTRAADVGKYIAYEVSVMRGMNLTHQKKSPV